MGVAAKPLVLPPWADTAVISTDLVQPVSSFISAGWPLSSVPPARQYWNWVLNYATAGIRYFCHRGIPDWDAAETYVTGDIVQGSNGILYRSLQNNNINNNPVNNPTGGTIAGTWWGTLTAVSPSGYDNSNAIPTTSWVNGALTAKANTSGSYLGLSVGSATTATSATTAGTAGSAGTVPWSGVQNHPTTVAGYGISDALTTAGFQTVNGDLYLGGNLLVYNHNGQQNQGAVSLGKGIGAALIFDGSNYGFLGNFSVFINGQQVATQAWVAQNYLTQASAAATYLSQAAAASTYATLAAFGNSLGNPGYQRLPGGLILEWGYVTSPSVHAIPVSFPVTFPHAALGALCNTNRTNAGGQGYNFVSGLWQGGATFVFDSLDNSGSNGGWWLAWGW